MLRLETTQNGRTQQSITLKRQVTEEKNNTKLVQALPFVPCMLSGLCITVGYLRLWDVADGLRGGDLGQARRVRSRSGNVAGAL